MAASSGRSRQVFLGKNMLFDRVGIFTGAFPRFYREQLALVIPLIKRGMLIEALVALQPDQFGAMHRGERLADLGLADAGLAFQQQRPFEKIHQPQRGGDIAVGDIADGGELVGDFFALEGHDTRNALHYRHAPRRRGIQYRRIENPVPVEVTWIVRSSRTMTITHCARAPAATHATRAFPRRSRPANDRAASGCGSIRGRRTHR